MFIAAIAKPRKMPDGTYFDGKIGIWPIGRYEAAKRDSVNRAKGTLVWKNETVNTKRYREYLFDFVLPAIANRWPKSEWNDQRVKIRIQQDGAGGHINVVGKGSWNSEDKYDRQWYFQLAEEGLDGKIELYD